MDDEAVSQNPVTSTVVDAGTVTEPSEQVAPLVLVPTPIVLHLNLMPVPATSVTVFVEILVAKFPFHAPKFPNPPVQPRYAEVALGNVMLMELVVLATS